MMVSNYLVFVVAMSLASMSKCADENAALVESNTTVNQMNDENGSKMQTPATNTNTKFIKPHVLAALIQPFQDKLETFLNSLNQADHPNNPQFFNPLKIWNKVQESGNKFFAGLHSLGHSQNTDYPVPFRAASSKSSTPID